MIELGHFHAARRAAVKRMQRAEASARRAIERVKAARADIAEIDASIAQAERDATVTARLAQVRAIVGDGEPAPIPVLPGRVSETA
jgi:multidrug resistance efflux pump